MLNNKDLNSFLKKTKPITSGVIAINIPEIKNSFTSYQIASVCSKNNIKCIEKKNIIEANKFLIKNIKAKDILVTGSLYLVGKVRNLFI